MSLEALKNSEPWDWPASAGQVILKVLQDTASSPEDRALAAEFGGDPTVVNVELIEAILRIIHSLDETEDLRSTSVMALGPVLELLDMGDLDDQSELRQQALLLPEILHTLHTDKNEPIILRRRALETSVRYDQDWHAEAIAAALKSSDTAWHRTAVFAMRFVPGFENQILEALGSDDPDTEFQAICAADVWQLDPAWGHVLDRARNNETEKYLRMAALEAMASIRPDAAAEIIAGLGEFEDEEMNELADEILGMIEDG